MKKQNNIIDLEDFRTQIGNIKSKVFTGRDRGEDVRERSRLNDLFEQYDKVKLIIPKGIYSITPSFLEELFRNIVEKNGRSIIEQKLELETNGYDLQSPLEEAIERILQHKTGLDK